MPGMFILGMQVLTERMMLFCPFVQHLAEYRALQTPRKRCFRQQFQKDFKLVFKHFKPIHVTEQRDQGLPLLLLNCEQKFTGNICAEIKKKKKKPKKKTVWEARVLAGVCLTLLFLQQEFKESSHNLDLSRVKIKNRAFPKYFKG